MSHTVKNPNEGSSKGFLWFIIALVAIVVVALGVFMTQKATKVPELNASPVSFTVATDGDTIVLKSESAKKDTPVADIYEDYSCPHCADLAMADHDDLKNAVEKGDLVVRMHPLNFLDRGNADGASTRAAAATWVLADAGDASAYWNLHHYIYENQAAMRTGWDADKFADAAAQAGASEEAVAKIRSGDAMSDANAKATANAELLKSKVGSVSSPVVFVNDSVVTITGDAQGKPKSWVADELAKLQK